MSFRFALAVAAVIMASSPEAATAQASASAVVRATIRPGNCPAHSRCDDNPGKGPKPKPKPKHAAEPPATIISVTVEMQALTTKVGATAEAQPLRISITAGDGLLASEVERVSSLLPTVRSLRAADSVPITVIVEY
jgi:hypothetical protein